jgi:hypothetical protein
MFLRCAGVARLRRGEYDIVGINEGIISTEMFRAEGSSYGLDVRSGFPVSRSTGTETCS